MLGHPISQATKVSLPTNCVGLPSPTSWLWSLVYTFFSSPPPPPTSLFQVLFRRSISFGRPTQFSDFDIEEICNVMIPFPIYPVLILSFLPRRPGVPRALAIIYTLECDSPYSDCDLLFPTPVPSPSFRLYIRL